MRLPVAAFFLATCTLARADTGAALPCSVAQSTFGAAELACTVAAHPQPQELNFSVSFEGVHDDSSAGLAARLDGQALACAAGSRTRIQGEGEGDTLTCRMAIPPASSARDLRLQLVWFHANPAPHTLRRE